VVASVSKPVKLVMTHADPSLTGAISRGRVKRISIGGSASRFASRVMAARREMDEEGQLHLCRRKPAVSELAGRVRQGRG